MCKRLLFLIIAGLFGVFCNPETLTASDSFTLSGMDSSGVVETIPLPEPEPVAEIATLQVGAPSAGYAYVPPANNIQYAGRVIQIVDVGDTVVDAGNHVNKYGDRFLYGHNSWGVFGALPNMGAGSVFSVTYGGVTTNYQIVKTEIFEKNPDSGLLQIGGFGDYMYSVATAIYNGVPYDLSLMTCYGESYGNGDASHRYVVFANAI